MNRKASAIWRGGLKDGKGAISTDSTVLKDTQYSFSTRFENGVGTNPEELIAAAHAGCFSMAFSAELGKANLTPESINTTATDEELCNLGPIAAGAWLISFRVRGIVLWTRLRLMSARRFTRACLRI